MLLAMAMLPVGAWAQVVNPVVDDFTQLFKKSEKVQTLTVLEPGAVTATSAHGAKTVYKVSSLTIHDDTSYDLKNQIYLGYGSKKDASSNPTGQWSKFSGYGTNSSELGTGYLQLNDRQNVVSIQGLKLGDVVKITCSQTSSPAENADGIFIRSPYVCYLDGDNNFNHINSITSAWKVVAQALISDREYIMTSDGSFDFGHSAGTTYTVSKISVKSLRLNSEGYATFSFPFDVEISGEGVAAYTATLNTSTNTITCTKIADGKVPAGTGVLLYGEANALVTLTKLDVAPAALSDNDLIGTTKADGSLMAKDGEKFQYVLSGDTFKKFTGTDFTPGKAYFETDAAVSAPSFNIVFFDDGTTGISEMQGAGEKTQGTEVFYNLNGQRVAQPTKGLYIVNGKKVIIK